MIYHGLTVQMWRSLPESEPGARTARWSRARILKPFPERLSVYLSLPEKAPAVLLFNLPW